MGQKLRRSRRPLLGAAVLAAGLLAGSWAPAPAHAAFTVCGGDPKVWLTAADGQTVELDLTITVNTSSSDVQNIVYTVSAPQGSTVSKTVYTGGALKGKETVVVNADNSPGTYAVTTTVSTATDGHAAFVTEKALEPGVAHGWAITMAAGPTSGVSTQVVLSD